MSKQHLRDGMTIAALRGLDPAPTTVLTDAERQRADAAFARILATPSHDPVPEKTSRPRRRLTRLLVPASRPSPPPCRRPRSAARRRLRFCGVVDATPRATHRPGCGRGRLLTCRAIFAVPDQGERVVIAEKRGEWLDVPSSPFLDSGSGSAEAPRPLQDQGDPAAATREGFMELHLNRGRERRLRLGAASSGTAGQLACLPMVCGTSVKTRSGSARSRATWAVASQMSPCTPPLASTSRRPSPTAGSPPGGHRPSPAARTSSDGRVDLHSDPRRRQRATDRWLSPRYPGIGSSAHHQRQIRTFSRARQSCFRMCTSSRPGVGTDSQRKISSTPGPCRTQALGR